MKLKLRNTSFDCILLSPISEEFADSMQCVLFLEAQYGNLISFPQTNPNNVSENLYSNRKGTVDALGDYVRSYGTDSEIILEHLCL